LPPILADVPQQIVVERLGLLPIMRFQPTPLDGWGRVLKRTFDIVMATSLLIVLSPILLLITLGILTMNGWPIFYVSKRVGQEGRRTIRLLKFRTMVPNADLLKAQLHEQNHRQGGPLFKVKNDPRVTPFGLILRRFSLDELPQLLNVITGTLSLVGPRPHLLDEVERYEEDQRRVFAVKPGLTGLAQVSGRSDLQFEDEVRLDLRYIEEWSIFLDLWVLWRTIFVVLSRKGAD
jgi:lipopolysaccharide/colanic/teichoic acid biosynthesis glycosyltransferase